MGYPTLAACVSDLERTKQLVRIDHEIDPNLEIAAIHRRVYHAGGPALLFTRVKGCSFPMLSNLFGTLERSRFLFRDTIETVRKLVELKIDPANFAKKPFRYWNVPFAALKMLPKKAWRSPLLAHQTTISQLPKLKCWPNDGGSFVTLPLVYSEDPNQPGWKKSNLGMYRVQLDGNEYKKDQEIGLHYQIHRGIGVHHAAAIAKGEPLKVNIHIGGPPALMLSAVMPLPEGLSELTFAGALGGRRIRLVQGINGLPMLGDADFCISGVVDPHRTLPEGPFGDHLGYYAKVHDFPVLQVQQVYHKPGAIWPFTVVGRPPQEDTSFGELIHEITGPVIPSVLPGVKAVHAVDASGVHPLLLAIGSERYVPYASQRKPQELLTIANAILGQGQLSLAKYLFVVAQEDDHELDIHDIGRFMKHVLERVDWRKDLHFQTCTTIDTLDYSGTGFNEGSKVVIAAAGQPRRSVATQIPDGLRLPEGFKEPKVCLPGILAVQGPRFAAEGKQAVDRFVQTFGSDAIQGFPLILLVDDSDFCSRHINNWIWVTFTRSNPAADIHGIGATTVDKHWGCTGSLIIDGRIKPHHAEPLEDDPAVVKRIESLAATRGPLHGLY
ncbi:MAG: UbiD family decarboxylase [Planctomycetia bacterium]|nr:UbiD family decarboxylase [Planctomycetia bacterium]